MVVGEEVKIGAQLDFIEQNIVITLANNIDNKILARIIDREVNLKTESFELDPPLLGELREIASVDRGEAESLALDAGIGKLSTSGFWIISGDSRDLIHLQLRVNNRIIKRIFVTKDGADNFDVDTFLNSLTDGDVIEEAASSIQEGEDAASEGGLLVIDKIIGELAAILGR